MNDVSAQVAGTRALESLRLRQQLTSVLRASTQFVTIDSAVEALGLDRRSAAKLLSRWAQQGWLKHVRRGLYAPVTAEAKFEADDRTPAFTGFSLTGHVSSAEDGAVTTKAPTWVVNWGA